MYCMIHANLSPGDIHVCILDKGKLIAYSTVLTVRYQLDDDVQKNALGIGSVSVNKNHLNKQYGFLIIQVASFYIHQQNSLGLLICKDELVPFYQKCNWIKYDGELAIQNFNKHCNLLSTSFLNSNKIIIKNSF